MCTSPLRTGFHSSNYVIGIHGFPSKACQEYGTHIKFYPRSTVYPWAVPQCPGHLSLRPGRTDVMVPEFLAHKLYEGMLLQKADDYCPPGQPR